MLSLSAFTNDTFKGMEQEIQKRAHATATCEPLRTKVGRSVLVNTTNGLRLEGCLLDVSSIVAGLRVPKLIPVGTKVKIEAYELLLEGNITHCTLTHGAYEADVELSVPMGILDESRLLDTALWLELGYA